MSIINRLVRAIESMSNIELGEQDRVGMRGEQFAEDIIVEGANEGYIRNPILPHPRKPGIFFETDILVYTQGTLFCVEIKNFGRGKVYYPSRYRTVYIEKGWFIFKRKVPQQVFERYDDTKMIQEKAGRNGIETREMPNPLYKTRNYANDLQRYLIRIDSRLQTVPIISVLAFSGKADISQVYYFDAGIIRAAELPDFFERHSNPTQHLSSLIQQAFHKIPTWDRILTSENEWINGVIQEKELSFKGSDNRQYNIPYAQILSVEVRREGTFSAYDDITIKYINGKSKSFRSASGEIHLERFGDHQIHKLRNVSKVAVGIANKGI